MRITSLQSRLLAGGLAVVGLGAFGAAPALASSNRSTVSAGILASQLPNTTVFGDTPSNTPETVSFIFKENNLAALEARAQTGFGVPLSVSQFAAIFGAAPSDIAVARSYLASYGISSSMLPGNVDLVANGTAGEFDSALDVTEVQASATAVKAADGSTVIPAQKFHTVTSNPSVPSWIAQHLVAILGLDNYAANTTDLAHTITGLTGSSAGAATNTCAALTGFSGDCNTPTDFANRYGLSTLYKYGFKGQGQTIGIITLATGDSGAPQYFWKNVLGLPTSSRTLTYDNIDGGAGTPSYNAGSDETDLDIEQSGAVAPDANIVVYQAPNTDSGLIDAQFTAAAQDIAGSVSQSWGESETYVQVAAANGEETSAYEAADDEAFLELDAQGQASFVSSGDDGAYDATPDAQTTNLAVDIPADSPYTTAAGGTTLPFSGALSNKAGATAAISVSKERMWGWDYLWSATATLQDETLLDAVVDNPVGDGGGFSAVEPTPSYQSGVSGTSSYSAVQELTPITPTLQAPGLYLPTSWSVNLTPAVVTGTATGRAMPDLGTDADPYTGYETYSPALTQDGLTALSYGWGGTSFVAPQLNGSAAVIDSALGRRTGFWNPAMYRAAVSSATPFTSLSTTGTSNDNLYYTGTAGKVFNAGAGLGTPNLTKLALDFSWGL